ncbi:MAG TPA: helix-turn-helix domain-containing protein [Kiritimatiellia bacterium]|nr:helix-turn-helix domain-containing protein [Kiritimatiellia bacterium]
MKTRELTLEQTAKRLGKSPRQIRRYIESGKIPASGGGHGVPYLFDRAAVAAFKRALSDKTQFRQRKEWSGVIDAETLGRIIHGVGLKQSNPALSWVPWFESSMLWKWSQTGNQTSVEVALRHCFPPPESIPADVALWVQFIAPRLSPLEMDYIAAMFIAVANPSRTYSTYERDIYGQALAAIADRNEADLMRFVRAYESGDVEALRRWCFGYKASTGKDIPPDFPEVYPIAQDILLSSAHKFGKDQRDKGRGNPSGNMIAKLLGIHRFQGARIIERLRGKLGRHDVGALFVFMGVGYVPRAWKGRPQG